MKMKTAKVKSDPITGLKRGWDNYGGLAPNKRAWENAGKVLFACFDKNLIPDKINPISEGGVEILFLGTGRRAWIICENSGKIQIQFKWSSHVEEFADFNIKNLKRIKVLLGKKEK